MQLGSSAPAATPGQNKRSWQRLRNIPGQCLLRPQGEVSRPFPTAAIWVRLCVWAWPQREERPLQLRVDRHPPYGGRAVVPAAALGARHRHSFRVQGSSQAAQDASKALWRRLGGSLIRRATRSTLSAAAGRPRASANRPSRCNPRGTQTGRCAAHGWVDPTSACNTVGSKYMDPSRVDLGLELPRKWQPLGAANLPTPHARPIWVASPDILRDGAVGWLNGGASNLAGGSYSGGQAGDALDFMGPARHLPSALSHLPSSQRSPQDLTV